MKSKRVVNSDSPDTRYWVGYARVSKLKRDKNGRPLEAKDDLSLDSQSTKIRAMAALKGIEFRDEMIYVDNDDSAKDLRRDGIQNLIAAVNRNEVSGVIISKLDRLTRRLLDLQFIIELFEKKKVALISTYETLDTTTAMGRAMLNLTMTVAQLERETGGERTRDALQAKLRRGESAGNAPYGWRKETNGGRLIEDLNERAIIDVILEWRDQAYSYAAIARLLDSHGCTTRAGGKWEYQYVMNVIRSVEERARIISPV